ncbi:MAG: outer membrane beta-barrel domain-containing protein [Proteobacteria bacterium]|nr:MAG: outer membrane beta-barrel domain-containing protein [Pseudomonadota bacterium]
MSFRHQFLALSLLASMLALGNSPNAQAAGTLNAGQQTEDGDYDFSWLDPEKKIYVVQNRKYLKQNRLEVALSGGIGGGDAYRKSMTVMPRIIFYPSETFGISVFGGFNKNAENHNVSDLKEAGSSVKPAVRDVSSRLGASVMWLPFYGKVNLFNQILYLDWHFEAGVGTVSTEIDLNKDYGGNPILEETSHFAFHWGTGQKFFITRNWAARIDFMAQYYNAPSGVVPGVVSPTTATGTPEVSYDNYYVTIGASYTF